MYCEGELYNSSIEYINVLSSIPIIFIGLYGLFYTKYMNYNIKLIHISLVLNGVGSFFNHLFSNTLSINLELSTSAFILFIMYSIIIQLIINSINEYEYNDKINISSHITISIDTIIIMILFSFMTYVIFLFSLINNKEVFYITYIVGFIFFIGIGMIYLLLIDISYKYENHDIYKYSCKASLIALSGVFNLIIDIFACGPLSIFCHALWHLSFCYSIYIFSQILSYITLINLNDNISNEIIFDITDYKKYLPVVMINTNEINNESEYRTTNKYNLLDAKSVMSNIIETKCNDTTLFYSTNPHDNPL